MKKIAILTEYGLHAEWVTKPLIEAGFAVDVCPFTEIPEYLATGKYNVVVVGRFYNPRRTKRKAEAVANRVFDALEAFVAKGGGLYTLLPVQDLVPCYALYRRFGLEMQALRVTQETGLGTFEGKTLAYSTAVHPDFAEGVSGV
ncbi:MAG: hypothetical protein FWF84_07665, partial [Kiritimatiellaeota bacterium]|nr:hypothetical protein [Kiritimatiellota bacterium]